jgi:hypothetical protein
MEIYKKKIGLLFETNLNYINTIAQSLYLKYMVIKGGLGESYK